MIEELLEIMKRTKVLTGYSKFTIGWSSDGFCKLWQFDNNNDENNKYSRVFLVNWRSIDIENKM